MTSKAVAVYQFRSRYRGSSCDWDVPANAPRLDDRHSRITARNDVPGPAIWAPNPDVGLSVTIKVACHRNIAELAQLMGYGSAGSPARHDLPEAGGWMPQSEVGGSVTVVVCRNRYIACTARCFP